MTLPMDSAVVSFSGAPRSYPRPSEEPAGLIIC